MNILCQLILINLAFQIYSFTCVTRVVHSASLIFKIVSVKSARAMWKVLMVQNCDNDILEGLAVANPLQIQNPLFLSWRDWRL
jgi:hypothetical protein